MARTPSRRDVLALAAGLATGGSLALGRGLAVGGRLGLGLLRTVPAAVALAGPALAAGPAKPARFKRGVNTWPWFSLTREYPAPQRDYAWPPYQENRPVPTHRDLERLAASGFDFIRIPADPGPFLAAGPERRGTLIADLMNAVRQAQSASLGVIVNIQTNDATHYWNAQTLLSSTQAPEFAAYRALVAEIAGELAKLAPGRIALEPVNEPPQACSSADWSRVQIALLSAARAAGPNLTLIATGACGSMVAGLDALDPAPLALLEPLLYTFHFYEPYLFSHQGAPWMREPVYRALNNVPWPGSEGSLEATLLAVREHMQADHALSNDAKTQAYAITQRLMAQYFEAAPDRPFLARYLDAVSAWSARNRIPPEKIVMGEFGVVKTTWRFTGADEASRMRYIRDVREAAETRGFGWAFWNLFDSMGLMDDQTHTLDAPTLAALGLVMPG